MSYGKARVGEVLELQRRPVEVDPTATYEEIGVRSFGKGIFHKEPVSGIDLGNKRVFRIEPGDLVLSNVFAWEGAVAVASTDEEGRIGSHRFMTYRPVDERIDAAWAAWFFLSDPGLELLRQASPGSAGRNRTLSIDRFEALEIPLPPIDDQCCMVNMISAITVATNHLNELEQRSGAFSTSLRVALCTRPDLGSETEMKRGWRTMPLGEALKLVIDVVQIEQQKEYKIAGVYSFGKGAFRRPPIRGVDTSYKKLHRLHTGQIVMSRLKAWEGALAMVTDEFDRYCVSPEFPTFEAARDIALPQYLALLVTSEQFWSQLGRSSRGIGARRERVKADRLLEQNIVLPPLEAQRQAVDVVRMIETVEAHTAARRSRIGALLPATLNREFGRLR